MLKETEEKCSSLESAMVNLTREVCTQYLKSTKQINNFLFWCYNCDFKCFLLILPKFVNRSLQCSIVHLDSIENNSISLMALSVCSLDVFVDALEHNLF